MAVNPALTPAGESEIGYGQLLTILLRRSIWFGGAIIGALGIATVSTLREEPVYQSSMQLLVEPNFRQTVDITDQQVLSSSTSQQDYATQLNLMRSNTFVEQAVESLLAVDASVCGQQTDQAKCVDRFRSRLSLSQVAEGDTETRIVDVRFRAGDPVMAQLFLEALGEVYLTYNEEQREERLEEGLALVNQQIEGAQSNLSGSREALKQFREAENLIDPEQQALAVSSLLREIEETEIDLRNQYLDVRAEYAGIQNQLNADPEAALVSSRLSQSSRYQQLLNSLQQVEIALAERLALYADADPGVEDLKSQRQERIELLKAEVARVLGETPVSIDLSEDALLAQGQLGGIDLGLVSNLVQAQVSLQRLAARRAGLAQARQRLQREFREFPSLIAEYDRIQPEIGIQQQSLEQLLRIREELSNELAQGGFNWDIVEAPILGRKIAPQPKRNLLLGAVAGAFIGGALAFGREALDKVVHTSEDLKKQVPLPLLGVIPEMPKGVLDSLPMEPDLEAPADIFSLNQLQPFRDAVDLIYKTIQVSSSQPLSSVMVTSARRGEGKTTLAIGLALSAARSHQRVLLVDANLRHPTLHDRLGVPNDQGVSFHGAPHPPEVRPAKVVPKTVSIAGAVLDVLPAGTPHEDPVRILSSVAIQRLLAGAEAHYDLVVLDAPPVLGVADSLQLASLCKGVVMVSRLDRSIQADLTEATKVLSQINTIGIVANGYRGDIGKDGLNHRNGHAAVPTGGLLKVGSIFRTMTEQSQGRPRQLAMAAVGGGLLSLSTAIAYEAMSPEVKLQLKSWLPQPLVENISVLPGSQLRR